MKNPERQQERDERLLKKIGRRRPLSGPLQPVERRSAQVVAACDQVLARYARLRGETTAGSEMHSLRERALSVFDEVRDDAMPLEKAAALNGLVAQIAAGTNLQIDMAVRRNERPEVPFLDGRLKSPARNRRKERTKKRGKDH
jgi:hypothetical protein